MKSLAFLTGRNLWLEPSETVQPRWGDVHNYERRAVSWIQRRYDVGPALQTLAQRHTAQYTVRMPTGPQKLLSDDVNVT